MKLIQAKQGKIGYYSVGPKYYLNEAIRLGEIILCIGKEEHLTDKPYIWIMGGIEQIIDYVSLAKNQGELHSTDASLLLSKLDEAKKKMPKTALERFAMVADMELSELKELLELAQVAISSPIAGVQDFSSAIPVWISKNAKNSNHASIH